MVQPRSADQSPFGLLESASPSHQAAHRRAVTQSIRLSPPGLSRSGRHRKVLAIMSRILAGSFAMMRLRLDHMVLSACATKAVSSSKSLSRPLFSVDITFALKNRAMCPIAFATCSLIGSITKGGRQQVLLVHSNHAIGSLGEVLILPHINSVIFLPPINTRMSLHTSAFPLGHLDTGPKLAS